ncbi:hypothetical protein FACS1894200_10290 [Spirochaetia bacterium]|nr:hypothetical protein FACS1894200_10290 [Spirochaetia bacterium]
MELAKKLPAASKIVGLMLTLSDRLVDKDELKRIWREFVDYSKLKVLQVAEEVGEERGIEKGIEIGEERGIEKGIEIGEEKRQLEDARNFKLMGFPLDKIALGTGLPLETIAAL